MNSQETLSVLHSELSIDSHKLIGVLDAFDLPYQLTPQAEQNERIGNSNYQQAPILYQDGKAVEIFWNILLHLDARYWNDDLQFGDADAKETLFQAMERCDVRIFPLLYREERGENSDSKQLFSFTKILQWKLKPKKKREREAFHIQSVSHGISDRSKEDAISDLLELLQTTSLPKLHHRILTGSIEGALRGAQLTPAQSPWPEYQQLLSAVEHRP